MNKKNQKRMGNRGFSLVELIIVIAIMAVLVAVLAPQYTKYVERSRVSSDIQALDEVLKAAQVITVDAKYNVNISATTKIGISATGAITVTDGASVSTGLQELLGLPATNPTITLKSKAAKATTFEVSFTETPTSSGVFVASWTASKGVAQLDSAANS